MNRRYKSALRLAALGGVIVVFCASVSMAAAPVVNPVITPAHPYVDDNVRVAFTDPRSLSADSEIDVVLFGAGVCSSSLADKTIKGPQRAGRRYRVRFRPADQIVGSGAEWCQGKAKVRIAESKNGSFVRKLAERPIRFRAKS